MSHSKNIPCTSKPQVGHSCKPSALDNIFTSYDEQLNKELLKNNQDPIIPIPLYKRDNPLRKSKKNIGSIRKLAKKHGSAQGELLEFRQVEEILDKTGYDHETINFASNKELFKQTIIDNITKGNVMFAAFSVDLTRARRGMPTTVINEDRNDRNEHAAVIHGFDLEKNTIKFSHWGQEWECTFDEFYESSMVLLDERKPEYYENVKQKLTPQRHKYDLAAKQDDSILQDPGVGGKIRKSLTPAKNTGFKGKLIVVDSKTKPEKVIQARKILVEEAAAEAQAAEVKRNELRRKNKNPASKTKKTMQSTQHDAFSMQNMAHVFLDGEIGGTPLEGFYFSQCLILLQKFLNWRQTNLQIITQDSLLTQQDLNKIQEQAQDMQEFEAYKSNIVQSWSGKQSISEAAIEKQIIKDVANPILAKLRDKHDIFVGGGYVSLSGGHRVIYRFKEQEEDDDGSIYCCIYDSSSPSVHATKGGDHYPIYAFKISPPIDDSRLSQWIGSLFKFQILPKIDENRFGYSDPETQKSLDKVWHSAHEWFQGAVAPAEKLTTPGTPQRSGTCVWKSIEKWLQAAIPERAQYRQLLLEYRLYCFHEAYRNTKQFTSLTSEEKILLKRSLGNMARMLNQTLKEEASQLKLSLDDKKRIIAQIKQWKKELQVTAVQKVNSNASGYDSKLKRPQYSLQTNNNLNSPQTALSKTQTPKSISPAFTPLNEKLDTALVELENKLQTPHLNEATYTRLIEEFCYQFNDPEKSTTFANAKPNIAQQHSIMNTLMHILEQYHAYNPQPTPKSIIIYLSLMSIIERLGQEQYFSHGEIGLSGFSVYGQPMQDFLDRLVKNPFLNTMDPKMDLLLTRVKLFYSKLPQSPQQPLQYYSDLISQSDLEEKKVLQQQSAKLTTEIQQFFKNSQPEYYYYLNQEERTKIQKSLPKLTAVFSLQTNIEKFQYKCLNQMAALNSPLGVEQIRYNKYIDITKKGKQLELQSVFPDANNIKYILTRKLLPNDNNFTKDTPFNLALLNNYDGNELDSNMLPYVKNTFSTNLPQLPNELSRNCKQNNERAAISHLSDLLRNIHINGDCQVITLLSTLIHNPDWLVAQDSQNYILRTVFQPGVLLQALTDNDAVVWDLLEQLWHKNQFNQAEATWFVLKLAAMISGYALNIDQVDIHDQHSSQLQRLYKWQKEILHTVEQRLQQPPNTMTPLELMELHQFRLESLLHLENPIHQTHTEQFLTSYWFLALHYPSLDGASKERLQHILDNAYTRIAQNNLIFTQIPSYIKEITGDQTIALDAARRVICVDNKILCYLPGSIESSTEYRELFPHQQCPLTQKTAMQMQNIEYEVYQWTANNQQYRALICSQTKQVIIQKQQDQSWYSYAAVTKTEKNKLGFANYVFESPPPPLQDPSYRVWFANPTRWFIVTKDSTQALYTQNAQHCFAGPEETNIRCVFPQPNQLPADLLRFEDAQFVRILESSERIIIHLERYGLELMFDEQSKTYQTLDKRYIFYSPENSSKSKQVLDLFGTGLIMHDTQDANNPDNQALMIPIKPYYIQKKIETTTNYAFIHNFSSPQQHNQYAVFPLKNGAPTATSTHDQLYLAYLYLAQDRPRKALECMRACSTQGTIEELERLWWIVEKLPENEPKISNSRVVALQLLALHMVLNITKRCPNWSAEITHSPRYIELSQWISDLSSNLQKRYCKYHQLRNNIPINMQLKPAEEKSIISYCTAKQSTDDIIISKYAELFPEHKNKSYYTVNKQVMQSTKHFIKPQDWEDEKILTKTPLQEINFTQPDNNQAKQALECFHPYMDDSIFLKNFSTYCAIARHTQDNKIRNVLKNFCITAVACYANVDDFNYKKNRAFMLMSEMLWTVLHNAQSFSEKESIAFEEIIKMSKKLTIPPIVTNTQTFYTHYEPVPIKTPNIQEVQSTATTLLSDHELTQKMFIKYLPTQLQQTRAKLIKLEETYKEKISTLLEASNEELPHEQFLKLQQEKKDFQEQILTSAQTNIFIPLDALDTEIAQTCNAINVILQDRQDNTELDIAELGKTQEPPSMEVLLHHYPQLQNVDFLRMGVKEENLATLHAHFQLLLSQNNAKTRLKILSTALQGQAKTNIINALVSQPKIARKHEALFQYIHQLALRPEQIDFLNMMLEGSELDPDQISKVLQLIMGGGKTKVILPLWAYAAADGVQLPIILVPEMSLQTNFFDLAITSKNSFQQEAYCLRFDRDTPDNPASLQELYDTLQTVREHKGYVVSTLTTWQSIELKYLELLNQQPTDAKQKAYREQQLLWLGKILNLARTHSTVAIDEAHALLQIRKELNYSIGAKIPIDPEIIDMTLDLYFWLDEQTNKIGNYINNPEPIIENTKCQALMQVI